MGYIEGEDRNQIILFPESIDEYVSDNNSIRIIDEYIKQLNLKNLHFKRAATPFNGETTLSPQRYVKTLPLRLPQPHPFLPDKCIGSGLEI